jgi:hypothetical protein
LVQGIERMREAGEPAPRAAHHPIELFAQAYGFGADEG